MIQKNTCKVRGIFLFHALYSISSTQLSVQTLAFDQNSKCFWQFGINRTVTHTAPPQVDLLMPSYPTPHPKHYNLFVFLLNGVISNDKADMPQYPSKVFVPRRQEQIHVWNFERQHSHQSHTICTNQCKLNKIIYSCQIFR
jgi:hypothetical protein